MKKQFTVLSFVFCLVVILTPGCGGGDNSVADTTDYAWEDLIDKDLSNWDTYLSFKHKVDYDGTPPKDESGNLIEPIGINKPGFDVFTTVEEGNDLLIKVGGEYYGCIATKNEYDNYHFQLKFKWGDKKWIPRMNKMKDSGILYHSVGNFGAEHWRSWMMSQEFQIMEAHTGDFWSQATSAVDIRAFASESGINPIADASQDFLSFGERGEAGKYCLRSNNYEKPHGEWNTLDLYTFGDKSLHVVNGHVVMILQNSRYLDDDGQFVPLTKGKIQLQSEAAELYYKDVRIRSIDSLGTKYKALF